MRRGAADLCGRLVLAQALVDHLAKQVVLRPGQILDFGDKLRPHPMHAAQDERGAEPAGARRRDNERHLRSSQRLQVAPQALKLRVVDAGVSAD
jgi:hypothetical protein